MVALSTTKAEYINLTEAINEALWLKGLVQELDVSLAAVEVNCDSQSTIHLSKNQNFHERTKQIDVRLHFIRDMLSRDEEKVATEENTVNMITKSLSSSKFHHRLELLEVTGEEP